SAAHFAPGTTCGRLRAFTLAERTRGFGMKPAPFATRTHDGYQEGRFTEGSREARRRGEVNHAKVDGEVNHAKVDGEDNHAKVDRPTVGRPEVDRPEVDRPKVNRAQGLEFTAWRSQARTECGAHEAYAALRGARGCRRYATDFAARGNEADLGVHPQERAAGREEPPADQRRRSSAARLRWQAPGLDVRHAEAGQQPPRKHLTARLRAVGSPSAGRR